MQIKIDDILKQKERNRNWLSKKIGISYPSMVDLCEGRTESIKFRNLENICNVLECEIADILILEKEKN